MHPINKIFISPMQQPLPMKDRTFLSQQNALVWWDLRRYSGGKIYAIKVLREVTGLSLRDAKDAVECVDGMMMPLAIFMNMKKIAEDRGDKGLFTETNPHKTETFPARIFC